MWVKREERKERKRGEERRGGEEERGGRRQRVLSKYFFFCLSRREYSPTHTCPYTYMNQMHTHTHLHDSSVVADVQLTNWNSNKIDGV